MTNSTNSSTSAQKPVKAKGPIRFEAVVPITVIVLLIVLYTKFFFDGNLRSGIEWVGTYVHGAEVNVGSVNTSFLGGSFTLRNLQVTDKTNPTRNLISLGEIRFKFNWDALLRLKFVVDDAGIETIQLYSPRKSPGWVKPPEPPSQSKEPSAIDELESHILAQTEEKFSNNILGDLAKVLGGQDEKEVLKQIQGQLKAEQFIKDLSAALKDKEKEWKERLSKLPKKEEFETLRKRAEALKFDTKNPSQFAKDLKEAKAIVKEADDKIDELKNTGNGITTDVDNFNKQIREIDDLIKKDIDDIENRLKIGKIDYADFSKDLFGRMFSQHLVTVGKYAAVAKQYMPPKKDPSERERKIVPRARGKGENIRYPKEGGYPLFWLRKATISSKATPEGFSGNIEGQLTDVSTDPTIVKNPMLLTAKGEFPKQDIYGVRLLVTVDHRTNNPKEQVDLQVDSFPLENLVLSDSSDAKLALTKATGSTDFSASLQNAHLIVESQSRFTNTQYDISARSKVLQEAMNSILPGIPVVTLNARATGSWKKLDLHINSNLGKELAAGMQKFIKAKVDAMKQQIRSTVDARIKGEKEKLNAEYAKIKGEADKILKDKKEELDKAKSQIESQAKGKQKDSSEDLKQKGKDLLKKLKF